MMVFASQTLGTLQAPGSSRRKTDGWIFGTWDFKWSLNKVLRIAFQKLPEGQHDDELLDYAIKRFGDAIEQWRSSEFPAAIGWEFEPLALPSPAASGWGPSQLTKEHGAVDYDILVSFAGLPVRLPPPKRDDPEIVHQTQVSELGCYAARVDYGTPTMFLGPDDMPPGVKEWTAKEINDWLNSADFIPAAVHEFGHALGIPHAHQNPRYRFDGSGNPRVRLKGRADVITILKRFPRFRHFSDKDVEPGLLNSWSHRAPVAGRIPFSDWQPPPADPLEQNTCMAHPGWSMFLENSSRPAPLKELERPTEYDHRQLALMYPKR